MPSNTTLVLRRPDGALFVLWYPSTGWSATVTLPSTGTYSLLLDPSQAGAGAVTLSVATAGGARSSPARLTHGLGISAPRPTAAVWTPAKDRAPATGKPRPPARAHARAATAPVLKARVPRPSARPRARPKAKQAGGITAEMRRYRGAGSRTWHPAKSEMKGNWYADRPASPWARVPSRQAIAGHTGLAGQVLAIDGTPLHGVAVRLDGSRRTVHTDEAGRFLVTAATGGHRVLVVDGGADGGGDDYGRYETGVDLVADRTTTLDQTVWLTKLDPDGDVTLPSPTRSATVITNPNVPGLEVRLPAGSVIKDRQGRVLHHLNVSPISVDRPPFPLPRFLSWPTYFTVQPGGAYASKGAQIIYPNYANIPAHQRVDFWNYDPHGKGWFVYGHGTVTADRRQIVPDPGVRVWEFTGAMISSSGAPPATSPTGHTSGGDPVDLASGLFTYEKTDLQVADPAIPITVRRSYRPGDGNSYSFGVGTTSDYDIHLWSVSNYTSAELVLPDGGRVHLVRTSPGSSFSDAVYEARGAPGRWAGARMVWNQADNGWNLQVADGTIYVFGEYAPLQAIRDRFGHQLTLTRIGGPNGAIRQLTAPYGRWVRFTYDAANRVTEARDNAGRTVSYTYTSGDNSRLATSTDADGRTTTYAYDAHGRMETITDPRGITYLTNEYDDATGRVARQTMADGGVYDFAYQTASGPHPNCDYTCLQEHVTQTTVTEPGGGVRRVSFDDAGYLVSDVVDADGAHPREVTYTRQSGTGLVTRTTDALGRKTDYSYDDRGRITSVERAVGTPQAATTSIEYEAGTNQPTTITDPLSHVTEWSYDTLHRLTGVTDATGRETTYQYHDAEALPDSTTDAGGAVTSFTFSDGDLTSVTDARGVIRRYVDAAGYLSREVDATGRSASYERDPAGNLTAVDQGGRRTTFAYDGNDNLVSLTNPRGHSRTATYDVMDNLSSQTDELGRTETYVYDHEGDRTRRTDRRGYTTAYAYDATRRLTQIGYQADVDGTDPLSTVDLGYDDADRLTSADDFDNGSYSYTYDALDAPTLVATPEGDIASTFDLAGRRTSTSAAGVTTTYSYDDADRIAEVAMGMNAATFSYDSAGRRHQVTLPNEIGQTLTYDGSGDVTGIEYEQDGDPVGDLGYAYDASGRRTASWGSLSRVVLPAALSSATYDAANQVITSGGRSFAYDDDGHLLDDGVSEYSWDARGSLTSVAGPGASTQSFSYDWAGFRSARTIGGVETRYLRQDGEVVRELSGGVTSASSLDDPAGGPPLARVTASSTSTLASDALGDVVAELDVDGTATTSYGYGPFGQTISYGLPSDNTYRFAGTQDDGNGLAYAQHRYYDTTTGRFLSEDPLGLAGGDVNYYRYVGNDPINWADPNGLTRKDSGAGTGPDTGSSGPGTSPPNTIPGGPTIDSSSSTPRPGPIPLTGPPNTTRVREKENGDGTIRVYGPDGNPIRDVDFGHDHGAGDPHVHDWAPPGTGGPSRLPGRPPEPGDLP
jgi:RHS repeat-associated protein